MSIQGMKVEMTGKLSTPFPSILPRPRDGEFRERWPGTEVVKKRGTLKAGRWHGRWEGFFADGQPHWITDYVDGLDHGEQHDFTPSGQEICCGRWERGERRGDWIRRYPSGAHKQTLSYDDEGKAHGPFSNDAEDGSPEARGEFWHGQRHGLWTWYGGPAHERVVSGYWRGARDQEEAAWYPGGQLAYRRFWRRGVMVGDWEEYYPGGAPKLKVRYERGVIAGPKTTWDEQGKETVEVYVDGLSEKLAKDEKKLAKIAAKVVKKRDEYAKRDALNAACGYPEVGPLLMRLWRSGLLALEQEQSLWQVLAEHHALVKADELLGLLSKVTAVSETVYCGHLPGWPRDLDTLVAHVYDLEPAPFEARFGDLPTDMRRGVAFVLARAGVDVGEALDGQLDELTSKHVDDYGMEDRILWWVDGELEEVQLYDTLPEEGHRREPNAHFYQLVELFGTREEWAQALLERVLTKAERESTVPWDQTKDALPLMTEAQLVELLNFSGYEGRVVTAFREWRADDGEALAKLAAACDKGRGKIVANLAVQKLASEGKDMPPALLEAMDLNPGSPSPDWVDQELRAMPEASRMDPAFIDAAVDFTRGDVPWFPSSNGLFEALACLDESDRQRVYQQQLEDEYARHYVASVLPFLDDAEIWPKALDVIEDPSGSAASVAFSLGMLPARALPLLVSRHAGQKKKDEKEMLHHAILLMLARMADRGEAWDAKFDVLIRTNAVRKSYEYRNIMPMLQKIVHRLPAERAEKVLLANLDTQKKVRFCRAFRFIGSHPSAPVLQHAFAGLLDLEPPLKQEEQNELRAGLQGLTDKRVWTAWLLRNGVQGLKSVFEQALGHQDYTKLLEEIQQQGVEAPKELDAIEKAALLADKALQKGGTAEIIYLLRPKETSDAGTFNLRGGKPPGVGDERWPSFDDEPMVHLFSLDLTSMPELASRYPKQRVISVFCANPDMNEAFEPYSGQTAIVFSTAEQAGQTLEPPDEVELRHARGFEVVSLRVPVDVWSGEGDLHGQLFTQSARVLGSSGFRETRAAGAS